MAASNDPSDMFNVGLSPDPIRFEPVSKLTHVFFDEANCQIFAVRSGGTTGVVVKGPDKKTAFSFRMVDKGELNLIKFSPDNKILSVQRSSKSVEFINFNGELDSMEYSQSCKGKMTKILGFCWTNVNEVVFITDHGIEHYQIIPEKHTLKALKSYNVSVNWYVYHAESTLLLLSSGNFCNVMYPFHFKSGSVQKLSKFDIDLPSVPKTQKNILLERDIYIATVYYKIRILVLRHQSRTVGTLGAEIVIYSLQKDGPPRKTNVLKLDMSGRFAVNVIDNIIIVHHQSSKMSMLYDIEMPGEFDGFYTLHEPIAPPCPLKPFMLKVPSVPSHNMCDVGQISCELYSPNWIVFQPNVIIDPKLGCLWHVHLYPQSLVNIIHDKCQLLDFLLLRQHSKSVILNVCHDYLVPDKKLPLKVIAKIFDKLNNICQQNESKELFTSSFGCYPSPVPLVIQYAPVVSQSDLYSFVFIEFESNNNYKYTVSVLLEYIRSLTQYQLHVQRDICKLLINILVQHKQFYQLHQFLQYKILNDSKSLAYLMLSLQNVYPPAHQLALDMLKRLKHSSDGIIEVLLSQKQVLPALRFLRSNGNIDTFSAPKYFSVVATTSDHLLFYAVYKFFEQRNIKLKGISNLEPDEHWATYLKQFESMFNTSSHSEFIPF